MPSKHNVTPARISFDLSPNQDGSQTQELRFHTVYVEAHEASAQLTKFPVQTGFSISNHAIRQNRRVVIEGFMSRIVINKTVAAFRYGTANDPMWMFNQLESLVNNSIPSKVTTNLGVYRNVVFVNFKTQQQEGMVDGMKFTIVGEEVQVKPLIPTKTIKNPVFQELDGPSREAAVQRLAAVGITVTEDQIISEALIVTGDGFKFTYKLSNGATKTITFVPEAQSTNGHTYSAVTDHTELATSGEDPSEGLNVFALGDESITTQAIDLGRVTKQLPGAANHLALCLVKGIGDIATGIIDDLINTVYGFLSRKLREALLKTVRAQTDDLGKILMGMALDCLVGTAIRTTGAVIFDTPADTLYSKDQLIGEKGILTNEKNRVLKGAKNNVKYKLTRISKPVERRYPGSTNYGPYNATVPSIPVP